jgi:hypothetical protein
MMSPVADKLRARMYATIYTARIISFLGVVRMYEPCMHHESFMYSLMHYSLLIFMKTVFKYLPL